jgi:hypothetical protein
MNSVLIANSLPLIIGFSLIIMGLLYILMPVRSLLRLDRKVTAWIYAAPNPAQRMEVVAAVSKTIGAFVTLCGVVYVILTVTRQM